MNHNVPRLMGSTHFASSKGALKIVATVSSAAMQNAPGVPSLYWYSGQNQVDSIESE
jgi:hypothetical protein